MNPMTPNIQEKEINGLIKLLIYVKKRIDFPISNHELTILADPYPTKTDRNFIENELFHMLFNMESQTYQAITTSREYEARHLKEWWENFKLNKSTNGQRTTNREREYEPI